MKICIRYFIPVWAYFLFLVFELIESLLKLGSSITINALQQFGYAEFYSLCECKLVIIEPNAYQIPIVAFL